MLASLVTISSGHADYVMLPINLCGAVCQAMLTINHRIGHYLYSRA